MATIIPVETKKGRHWRVRIRRVDCAEISKTLPSKKMANEWATTKEADLNAGRYRVGAAGAPPMFTDVLDKYLKRVLPKKSRKVRYVAQQRAQLEWWKVQLKKYRLPEVTTAVLAECRDELAGMFSNATANRYMAAISHVFTKVVDEWELLPANPMKRLKKLKEAEGRSRFLTEDERAALMAAARVMRTRVPLLTIIVLAISTGARKSELLNLLWTDVDFERGRAIARDTKNSRIHVLFISGYAKELLQRHYKQRHRQSKLVFPARCGTRPAEIDLLFAKLCKKAGIKDFHFHDLRHTAASYMAMHGKAATDIKAALGHRSVAMVDRYAHLAASHMDGVMEDVASKIFPQEGRAYA